MCSSGQVIGFEARTTISRKDVGLGWGALVETGDVVVGDEVKIELHVEAVRDG